MTKTDIQQNTHPMINSAVNNMCAKETSLMNQWLAKSRQVCLLSGVIAGLLCVPQIALASSAVVSDAVGTQEVWAFEEIRGVQKLTSRINSVDGKGITQTFDSNSNLTSRTDEEGRKTVYAYNAANQRISKTVAVGTPEERATTYEYIDANTDLATVITEFSVNSGQFKTTVNTYDEDLNIISRKIDGYTSSGEAVSRITTYEYDSVGKVTQIDGPRTDIADITTLGYYDCNSGSECGQLRTTTNALGHTTTFDSYDQSGRLLQSTDANNVVTTYEYHPRGWLLSQTLNTTPAHITSYEYDGVGQMIRSTSPDGIVLTYEYDDAHDLRTVIDNVGNIIEYQYDAKGNRVLEKTTNPDSSLAREVSRQYDIRNYVQSVNAAGSLTQVSMDAVGNTQSQIDPNENPTTTHQYDALDRLQDTVDALTNTTNYDYNVADQLTSVTAANGTLTTYDYDDLGNLLEETSADRGTIVYRYDSAGNMTSMTDARGVTANYQYDAINRLLSIEYPQAAENVSYGYDSGTNGIGRLTTLSDQSGSTEYSYDVWGNIISTQKTERDASGTLIGEYVTTYTYDIGNRVIQQTNPDGLQLTYERDAIGRVTDLTSVYEGDTQVLVSNRRYRADGVWTNQDFGNGLNQQKSYDQQGRLTTHHAGSYNRAYGYDANGNILNINGTLTSQYDYDALDRLSQEDNFSVNDQRSFSYDENGNRLQEIENNQTTTLNYQNNSNQLTSIGNTNVVFDDSGRLITDETGRAYDYNNAGRLQVLRNGSQIIASYVYNANQLRTRKTVNGETTIYHYDLAGNLISESDGSGHHAVQYVYIDGERIAMFTKTVSDAVESGVNGDYINLDFNGHTSYGGGQDQAGDISINSSRAGDVFSLTGNRWRKLSLPITITPTTELEVVFGSSAEGEIHGIGVDTDNRISANRTFQLFGTQRWGNQSFNTYNGNGVPQLFRIPIGTFFTGDFTHLTFTMDDDRNTGANSTFRNVRFVDSNASTTGSTTTEVELHYYINDHLSTPQRLVGQDQAVTWEASYEAFGATDITTELVTNNHRFPGQYYDVESGLNYNWNRYYDAETGRYVTSDPIGLNGGANTFVYVANAPIIMTDSTGLISAPSTLPFPGFEIPTWPAFSKPKFNPKIIKGLTPFTACLILTAYSSPIGAGSDQHPCYDNPDPSQCTLFSQEGNSNPSDAFPPGFLPADVGAREWGRRKGVGADSGMRRFHRGVKNSTYGGPKEDYGVNPDTGEVIDGNGEWAGNLGDESD